MKSTKIACFLPKLSGIIIFAVFTVKEGKKIIKKQTVQKVTCQHLKNIECYRKAHISPIKSTAGQQDEVDFIGRLE